MKIKVKIFLLLLLIIQLGSTYAQSNSSLIKRVNIGNNVSQLKLNNIVNFPANSVKIMDFKGKIVILDFWTFGCLGCVQSWPKLMEIQHKFQDKVQIILVNIYENEQSVKTFIQRQEKISGQKMSLPVACGDRQLKEMFPHQLVPHIVFIDQGATVKYISEGTYLNDQTLERMLNKEIFVIPEKTDRYADVSSSRPLFMDGNIANSDVGANVIWSSVITPYSPNLFTTSVMGKSKLNGRSYAWISNYPIDYMFRILYGTGINPIGAVSNSRVSFKNVDSTLLVHKVNGIFQPQNLYTIQLTAKRDVSLKQLKEKMIAELEICFGLKTGWQKQKKLCLVVSRSDSPVKEYVAGEKLLKIGRTVFGINKVYVKELIDYLSASTLYYLGYPIVDETNYHGLLGSINFEADKILDYKDLGRKLSGYGFSFSIQEREVETLVISMTE